MDYRRDILLEVGDLEPEIRDGKLRLSVPARRMPPAFFESMEQAGLREGQTNDVVDLVENMLVLNFLEGRIIRRM
jgi:hypothetical protein